MSVKTWEPFEAYAAIKAYALENDGELPLAIHEVTSEYDSLRERLRACEEALRDVLTTGAKPDKSVKENRDAFDAAILRAWALLAEQPAGSGL